MPNDSRTIHDGDDKQYRIGIMLVDINSDDPAAFDRLARQGVAHFQKELETQTNLLLETFAFAGPPINPSGESYSPLDFIQLGISERAERNFSFLLIITDVDLSSTRMTYTLAMPSQITNVAIVSTQRLNPSYWGHDDAPDTASERLGKLMAHSFGRLLNLDYAKEPTNFMSRIAGVDSLDTKARFSDDQRARMRRQLPLESLDAVTGDRKTAFALKTVMRRFPAILRAVGKANPIKLVTKLPTMLATALSVIIVLIFAAETWDYAGAVSPYKITIFALFSFLVSVYVLYRAFSFDAILSRDGKLMESTVVTTVATALSLFAAVVVLFVLLGGLMFLVAETAFPDSLKVTWSSLEPVTSLADHFKLSVFLASIGVLAGSLGGAADSRNIVRNVLFVNDEV